MSYRECILRQPEQLSQSLRTTRESLDGFDAAPYLEGSIAVTGIGASYEAAVVVAAELHNRGRRAAAWHAVDLMKPGDPADIIVALSAGGHSIEPVSAIQRHKTLPSIAVTSEAGVPLAQAATSSVIFQSGADATPSSTGYSASLLAGGLLTDCLTASSSMEWDSLPDLVEDVIGAAALEVERLGDKLEARRSVDCVGAGGSLGSAGEAGLLVREAARIPASANDTLHYLHGPMEPNDGQNAILIFGDDREIALAHTMAEIGCTVLLVTTQDIASTGNMAVVQLPLVGDDIARAILEIMPAQLFAAELSDRAGLTDVKFRYRQTDTKIKTA